MSQEIPAEDNADVVLVLSNDLFFAMRIRNALKALQYRTVIAKSEAEFSSAAGSEKPVLGFIDFNHQVDWDALSPALAVAGFPTVAFGPHKDTAGFAAAKHAGVSRVISNGAFTSTLPDLVRRYVQSAE